MEQFSPYLDRFKAKRKKWGLDSTADASSNGEPESTLWLQIMAPDTTIGDSQCPISPAIRITNAHRLGSAAAQVSDQSRYISNVLSMIGDVCASNMLPGICGAGQTSIEVPLVNVTNSKFSAFSDALENCLNKHIQRDSFLHRQGDALREFLASSASSSSSIHSRQNGAASSSQQSQKEHDHVFFCGLPESGGMSKVTIGVRHTGNRKSLVVVIDSYWKPALDAFVCTLQKLAKIVLSGSEQDRETYGGVIDAMISSICSDYRTSSGRNSSPFCAKPDSRSAASSSSVTEISRNMGVQNELRFRCASVEYMESMSRFHRLCLMTKVLDDIYAHVLIDSHPVIENPRLYTSAEPIPVPSLDILAAKLAGVNALCGSSSRTVSIIDQRYCAESVHSTRRIDASNGNIWFFCRYGLMHDLVAGKLYVSYGDVGQGLFAFQASSESIADKRVQLQKRSAVFGKDMLRLYTAHAPIPDLEKDMCFCDIMHPHWCSDIRNFTTCGIKFSRERMTSTSLVSKAVHHQEYYRSMEPYIPVHVISNPLFVAPSILQYFDEQHESIVRAGHLRNIYLVDPMLTIVCSMQIDEVSLEDLLERAEHSNQLHLIISQTHIAKLWECRLGDMASEITSNKHNNIQYGENRSYYKISVQKARAIVQTIRTTISN